MANYWKIVNQILREADIILEVLDARLIDETRNKEIEAKANKQIIYVINKCDLVDKSQHKTSLRPSVFISTKERYGTTVLKKLILRYAKTTPVTVGVVGYPNTGKSSVINALSGRGKAKASSESGYTRGVQLIRAGKIVLLDTPGVIPVGDDELKQALISAIDFSKLREPDMAAMYIMEKYPGYVEKHYGVSQSGDIEERLERIAVKMNKLRKGGVADTDSAARLILRDWQRGLIRLHYELPAVEQ